MVLNFDAAETFIGVAKFFGRTLAVFRRDLKRLVEKGELNKDVQAAIIRKVVYKITVQPNGFEIHFHVGNSHYSRELGQTPSSRFFSFAERKSRISGKIQSVGVSSLLTNGDPAMIRTWDLLLRRQLLYPTELRGRAIGSN